MTIINLVVGAAALAAALGFACRLAGLNVRTHRIPVLVMNAGLGVACLHAVDAAWLAGNALVASLGRAGLAAGALCWLWESLPTWSAGPPRHTETTPGDLEDMGLAGRADHHV